MTTPATTRHEYSQLCAVAGALDVIGSRWTLLILRDLARTPLRFSDLQSINPGLSPTLLTKRLRELEAAGIVERAPAGPAGSPSHYQLAELMQPAILPVLSSLAELGAQMIEHDPPTSDPVQALMEQMRLNAHYAQARSTWLDDHYVVLDFTGWLVHVVVSTGQFTCLDQPPTDRTPHATVTFFPPTTLMRLMAGAQSIVDAEESGLLTIDGDRDAALELIRLLSFEP